MRPTTKKRTEDTGGADAFPFTARSWPAAKRSNIGGRGKCLLEKVGNKLIVTISFICC